MRLTDVVNFVEANEGRMFPSVIQTIYMASNFQLESERLHVELYDEQSFYLNKFLAYNSIPLIDIVDGPMQIPLKLSEYTENF